MNIITIGSKVVDDAIIKTNSDILNLLRIVDLSPLSFCSSVRINLTTEEKVSFLNKIVAPNEYTRRLFGMDLFREVFSNFKNHTFNRLVFDITNVRLNVRQFTFSNGMSYTITDTAILKDNIQTVRLLLEEKLGSIIDEQIIIPMQFPDNKLKDVLINYVGSLIKYINNNNIFFIHIKNPNQYISKDGNIAIFPNQSVIYAQNSFYKKCERIIDEYYSSINHIECPDIVINDERFIPTNIFNYNNYYYEFICKVLKNYGSKDVLLHECNVKQHFLIDDCMMSGLALQVQRNFKNRHIIILGKCLSLEYILESQYGIDNYSVLDLNDTDVCTNFESIFANKANKYFFVLPYINTRNNIYNLLSANGYCYSSDFICISHIKYTLKNFIGHYYDIFGNDIYCSNPCNIAIHGCGNELKIYSSNINTVISVYNESNIEIDENIYIHSNVKLLLYSGAFLKIGHGSVIFDNVHIQISDFKKVVIGIDCILENDVKLLCGTNYNIVDSDTYNSTEDCSVNTYDVIIGDHVTVCRDSFIMEGSNIGFNSIVRENSLVKDTFEQNSFIRGNPARLTSG